MKVSLITPERKILEADADTILVPTIQGILGIKKGHLPLITPIAAGELVLKKGTTEENFILYGGILEITTDKVQILADSVLENLEMNEEAIQAAVLAATKSKEEAKENFMVAEASARLEAQLSHLKVIKRKKARGRVSL